MLLPQKLSSPSEPSLALGEQSVLKVLGQLHSFLNKSSEITEDNVTSIIKLIPSILTTDSDKLLFSDPGITQLSSLLELPSFQTEYLISCFQKLVTIPQCLDFILASPIPSQLVRFLPNEEPSPFSIHVVSLLSSVLFRSSFLIKQPSSFSCFFYIPPLLNCLSTSMSEQILHDALNAMVALMQTHKEVQCFDILLNETHFSKIKELTTISFIMLPLLKILENLVKYPKGYDLVLSLDFIPFLSTSFSFSKCKRHTLRVLAF
ncbi:hypothetical protein GEMRC1_006108 [Eukaryota sp. GEM-RC1]